MSIRPKGAKRGQRRNERRNGERERERLIDWRRKPITRNLDS